MLHQNQPCDSWKEDFKVFKPYMGAYLENLLAIFKKGYAQGTRHKARQPSCPCDQYYVDELSFPCPYKHTFEIWLKMAQWLLIKDVSYVNDLGPMSRNDTGLQYSHIFINTFSFMSQAARVSEKSTYFTFSYRNALFTKFDLVVNRSRSLQGHHFSNL